MADSANLPAHSDQGQGLLPNKLRQPLAVTMLYSLIHRIH